MNIKIVEILAKAIDSMSIESEDLANCQAELCVKALSQAGYVIVPREPSREMWHAAYPVILRGRDNMTKGSFACKIYNVMTLAFEKQNHEGGDA